MTHQEEIEMHAVAKRLVELTEGTGWEMSRYCAVARAVNELTEYCAVCDCTEVRNRNHEKARARPQEVVR